MAARTQAENRARRGLSIAEVVVCTALVGLLLSASMKSLALVFQLGARAERHQDAQALAQQLLAEILQQPYQDPDQLPLFGRELGEFSNNRSNWDDVDDYHGWSAPPQQKDGTAFPGYDNWTQEVTIRYAKISDPNVNSFSDSGLKRITIKVTDPNGRVTTIEALRSEWGMLEQSAEVTSTVNTWVGNKLQVGSGLPQQSGVNVFNHAKDL